ncbi:MAG: pilus assembly protein [Firmicutes bacterium]|nr:pilus assembly protein [Bacillota bacterium]
MRSFTRRFSDKSGQASVEFALVLSVLVLVLMGTLELGRVAHAYLTVSHASREAARAAALGKTDEEVASVARSAAPSLDPVRLSVTVSPSFTTRVGGQPVTVRVSYSETILVPLIAAIAPNPFPVEAETVMRTE